MPSPKLPDPPPPKAVKAEPPPPIDYFDEVAKANRLRFNGVARGPDFEKVWIQVIDKIGHQVELFTNEELEGMGWHVEIKKWGVVLFKGSLKHTSGPWPVRLAKLYLVFLDFSLRVTIIIFSSL